MAAKRYPDNSEIFTRKAMGRRDRAAMTFAEKLDALDALRERVAPIIRARKARSGKVKDKAATN